MSYARFGAPPGSAVYVFLAAPHPLRLECCGCSIDGGSVRFDSTDGMIAHLRDHQALGQHVAPSTIARLEADRAENDEWMRTGTDPSGEHLTDTGWSG